MKDCVKEKNELQEVSKKREEEMIIKDQTLS